MDIHRTHEAFIEVWRLYKGFNAEPLTDTDWQIIISKTNQIIKKYDNDSFVKGLLSAVMDEYERIGKNEK